MTSILLTGIIVAFLATTMAAAYGRAPTRVRCPNCGSATQSIQAPPWLRHGAPLLRARWCPSCAWEGLGRDGPEFVPGRRISHDSGFHWGDERLPEDFGFRFASTTEAEPSAEPPHHPSGFRFSSGTRDATPLGADHFNWARRVGTPFTPSAPRGFRWGDSKALPVFEWRARDARRPRAGFKWKGVA